MIAKNELRVGNWYRCKIYNGKNDVIMQFTPEEYKYSHLFEPIELSPSILERCGFRKDSDFNYSIGLPIGNGSDMNLFYDTLYEEWDVKLVTEGGGFYVASIKHFHQLQNLHHAISQEELIYKQ